MYRIILTYGPEQRVLSGIPRRSEAPTLSDAVADARNAMFTERRQRDDGMPDGYLILDDQGHHLKAERILSTPAS